MRVVIVGAGLLGVTSAYYLRRAGHEVIVVERQAGPGRETSFANGAWLSPSETGPWNAPGCWRVLLASLGREDTALKLRAAALPGLTKWGVRFLRNSRLDLFERSTLSNQRLALYSLEMMQALRAETGIEYGRAARGSLRIFRDHATLAHAFSESLRLAHEPLTYQRLSPAQAVALEPGLQPIADELAGAIHCPLDETGDAHRFCTALAARAQALGVTFRFGTTVTAVETAAAGVTALRTTSERLPADHVVIAAGSYSTPLLQPLGIPLPVRPVKGYSVTFDLPAARLPIGMPIADDALNAVVVPLEGAVRAAGTAEFAGFDLALRPERVRNLTGLVQRILPSHVELAPEAARPWCGLRPLSVDGVPMIGATPIANLSVNTGHGPLGWTMAAGSGRLLADLVCARPTAVDAAPYALSRFD